MRSMESKKNRIDKENRETARFYKKLIYARNSPTKLKKLGYSVDDVDFLTAVMGNGSCKGDAIYALGKKNK